jgi:hypothetical protein
VSVRYQARRQSHPYLALAHLPSETRPENGRNTAGNWPEIMSEAEQAVFLLVRCEDGLHASAYRCLAYAFASYPGVLEVSKLNSKLVRVPKTAIDGERNTNHIDRWAT